MRRPGAHKFDRGQTRCLTPSRSLIATALFAENTSVIHAIDREIGERNHLPDRRLGVGRRTNPGMAVEMSALAMRDASSVMRSRPGPRIAGLIFSRTRLFREFV